jgi:hypothetical protein
MPVFDIMRLEDPARPGHGFVLIAVLRSPLAPHAVIVNDGLRYPRRNGATTRYLSEPEVAAAYRDRFTAINRQADRVLEVEKHAWGGYPPPMIMCGSSSRSFRTWRERP